MRFYTVYTITKWKEILCLYKCEKCGEMNLIKTRIKGQGQYDDRNAGFRKATVEANIDNRNQNANAAASDNLEDTIADLELNLNVKVLCKAGIRCKCRNCNKEPWWTMSKLNMVKKLATCLSWPAFILIIFGFKLDIQIPITFWALLAAIVCWGLFVLLWKFNEKRLENKLLPIFAENVEKLRERKDRVVEYKNVSI